MATLRVLRSSQAGARAQVCECIRRYFHHESNPFAASLRAALVMGNVVTHIPDSVHALSIGNGIVCIAGETLFGRCCNQLRDHRGDGWRQDMANLSPGSSSLVPTAKAVT